ncbi:MAG: AraC family transcriptional regulator, partial [Alphaproteobacteria bacterium]|nr:AraC family transcriptional regulator [Alphaproteobacteria bacterium]
MAWAYIASQARMCWCAGSTNEGSTMLEAKKLSDESQQALRDYQRIERALAYIEQQAEDQPELGKVAHHVGLSPFHFQSLFRRWVGISPKRFLLYVTGAYAKCNLAESQSVLDATFAVGLSGPSRLHDLFVSCEAMTPGEYNRQGESLEINYGFHPSPFGMCLLTLTARGVCGLAFFDGNANVAALADMQGRWPKANLIENSTRTNLVFSEIAERLGWFSAA